MSIFKQTLPGKYAINQLVASGCDLVFTTGGLSVDPDDVTKAGILQTGAQLVAYGAPILPGAMFLYALLDDIPIIGLPACVYYHRATVFNLLFPLLLFGIITFFNLVLTVFVLDDLLLNLQSLIISFLWR